MGSGFGLGRSVGGVGVKYDEGDTYEAIRECIKSYRKVQGFLRYHYKT